jgi:hypothetical protein
MSFFGRLFGGGSRKIPGILFSVSLSTVEKQDTAAIAELIASLAMLTAKHDTAHFAEIMFDGFDQDPRPIDEIPEAAAWSRKVQQDYPELIQWLTPGAMLRHLMCIVPGLAERLPGGQVALNFAAPGFRDLLPSGAAEAANRLMRLGVSEKKVLEMFLPAVAQNRQAALLG